MEDEINVDSPDAFMINIIINIKLIYNELSETYTREGVSKENYVYMCKFHRYFTTTCGGVLL